MAGIDRWKISPETRATFTAILDEAPQLGIDRDQVAAAGLPGLRALIALKQAAEAGTRRAKIRALADAQDALASLAHRKQSRLVNQVQARLLALQGRGSDTEMAHVTRGELVVPTALQSPALLTLLRDAAAARGIALDSLRVGGPRNHINPATGSPEFALIDPMTGQRYELPEADETQLQRDPISRAQQRLTDSPVQNGRVNQKDKPDEGGGYFGDRRANTRGVYPHQGVDIQGEVGEPVYAMGPGRIVKADGKTDPTGYGNQIVIDHGDGIQTQYGHLDGMDVKVGDEVQAGQAIGRVGRSGNAPKTPDRGDSHVHTEGRVDGRQIDLGSVLPQYGRPPRR